MEQERIAEHLPYIVDERVHVFILHIFRIELISDHIHRNWSKGSEK